ncbi:AAA family ATPase [Pseudomonas sp. BMW13]|uniref:AAA family ATPase n=1 Tax=Pseudomonas sp. BMW13 TaxID=2562590 RepID=UPI0015827AFD|nr:AAA family ATPase [Pseudomonas sp. BMW13]
MLSSLCLPFSSQEIPMDSCQYKNRISVIIGENGTRKSHFLRHILNDAIHLVTGEIEASDSKNLFRYPPRKIIAVSALPTDRFPSKYGYSDRSVGGEFEIDEYSYVGPRTATNIISRNQSARELVSALLTAPQMVAAKKEHLASICEQIGIDKRFSFFLRLVSAEREGGTYARRDIDSDILKVRNVLTRRINSDTTTHRQKKILTHEISRLDVYQQGIQEHIKYLLDTRTRGVERPIFPVSVDFDKGTVDYGKLSRDVLEAGFRYGFMRPTSLVFGHSTMNSEDTLSAGQWGMFVSLCTVTLGIQDNSLVLIDEPENGLHPSWQRNYLHNILSAIDHVKGCQVVVATHSPLLLSSLPLKDSDCILLRREADNVVAEFQHSPSGWDSNTLLEEVFTLESPRGPEITDLVNRALKIIGAGIQDNKVELKDLSVRLEAYRKNLPEADILKEVIATIIEVSS